MTEKATRITQTTQMPTDAAARAKFVRERLPKEGLFSKQTWRIAPEAFPISRELADELERLGPMLAEFYRACNLLYRHSASGKLPAWIAHYLDLGKPPELIAAARSGRFKADLPRVIRPDVLLTDGGSAVSGDTAYNKSSLPKENVVGRVTSRGESGKEGAGFVITELDSVPGGIGLTGWLYMTYGELEKWPATAGKSDGVMDGMLDGFWSIFGAERVRIVISEESSTYRPEMLWLAEQLRSRGRDIEVVDLRDTGNVGRVTSHGESHAAPRQVTRPTKLTVYRFFELFDIANEPSAQKILDAALRGEMAVTPSFKPWLEEKMQFAFLWHSQLRNFWRQELGEKTLAALQKIFPYTWIVDPTPLPPHAVIPELGIHDWREMAKFSQRERELVLKVSGFSSQAWGSRGVWAGHDLSAAEWGAAIEEALKHFEQRPCILQPFHRSKVQPASYFDFESGELKTMQGRARLCPYYFVSGSHDKSSVKLGGILATICPSDKKLLHGMSDAIMTPCKIS